MNPDPLRIISVENSPRSPKGRTHKRQEQKEELQARMEWLWKHDPESFNPLRNWFERIRLERTLELIRTNKLQPKQVADLGCGAGILTEKISQKYSHTKIDAVDIASLALEKVRGLPNGSITTIQDYIPHSHLKDQAYDLVLACELIGYLNQADQRLFFSEIARIASTEGYILVSTRIELNSVDALQRFSDLAETELLIKEWKLSYHSLAIRLIDFFKAPERFLEGSRNADYRQKALKKRYALSHYWYQLNSSALMGIFWKPVVWLATPFSHWLEQCGSLLSLLEKISRALWQEEGVTHAIVLAQRRPLTVVRMPTSDERPVEHKGKRFVWE